MEWKEILKIGAVMARAIEVFYPRLSGSFALKRAESLSEVNTCCQFRLAKNLFPFAQGS